MLCCVRHLLPIRGIDDNTTELAVCDFVWVDGEIRVGRMNGVVVLLACSAKGEFDGMAGAAPGGVAAVRSL